MFHGHVEATPPNVRTVPDSRAPMSGHGILGVNHANATMLGILQKHLQPFLDEYREIAYVAKDL